MKANNIVSLGGLDFQRNILFWLRVQFSIFTKMISAFKMDEVMSPCPAAKDLWKKFFS